MKKAVQKQDEIKYAFKTAAVYVCLQRLWPTHVRRIRQMAAQTHVTPVTNFMVVVWNYCEHFMCLPCINEQGAFDVGLLLKS